jgi:hypothetical protein
MKDIHWLLDITIAAYLSRDPDRRVKRLAKLAKRKLRKDKAARAVCNEFIKSPRPAMLARKAWGEFNG